MIWQRDNQDKYTEASETLTEAWRQLLEIGDVLGEAKCSQSLGDILLMQDKYTEASETLTEAQRQFLKKFYQSLPEDAETIEA